MADNTTSSASEESEQQITFTVKSSSESKYALTLPVSTTVGDLKQKLSTEEYANIPPDRQRLIYSGRVLKDPDTLASCKIKDGHTVHLVKGAASNSRQNPATPTDSTTTSSSVPAGTGGAQQPASNVPSNIAAGTGTGNPLAQLTGARYAGFHGLPGMDAFGADGGMGAPPNPDQMLRLLEDPNFASQMNEAMNNPAVVDMLRNNPMIRNNPIARQAIENPEFRRMMMNPDMIRMQMQMQRAMGGDGMGGAGGDGGGGFPMPGQTDTTEANNTAAGGETTGSRTNTTTTTDSNANANAAGNPFAALFGGGADAGAGLGTGAGAGTGAQQQQQQPGRSPGQNQNNPIASMTQHLMQNPDLMRQMMQMMGGGGNDSTTTTTTNPTGTGTEGGGANPFGNFNPFLLGGMGDFGALGGGRGGQTQSPPPDNRPPEERYEEQLRQLNEMGFYEFDRNVQALRRSGGSVQGAVEYLLSHP